METYTAKIKIGNFNTGIHYVREIEFESTGKETIGEALNTACRKVVTYNAVWWLLSLEMQNQTKFLNSFR